MVSDTIMAAMIGVLGSFVVSMVVGVVGYLTKDKLESIEEDIEEVKTEIENEREERKEQTSEIVRWLGCITDALQKNGMSVSRPDSVKEQIDQQNNG